MAEIEANICKLTGKRCIRVGTGGWGYCGGNRTFKGVCPEIVKTKDVLQKELKGEGRVLEAQGRDSTTVVIYHTQSGIKGNEGNYPYRLIVKGAMVRYQI